MKVDRSQRLAALDALSRDPAATEPERKLAAARAAEMRAEVGDARATYVEIEVDDELVAALDRAMARAAGVRNSQYRGARIRAAEHRLGRATMKKWREGRGPELRR